MSDDEDAMLRRRFAELREIESEIAPTFERVVGRAHGREADGGAIRYVGLAAAILGAIGLLLHDATPTFGPRTNASLADWAAPTDFLLRTPGHELLTTAPALGRSNPTGASLP